MARPAKDVKAATEASKAESPGEKISGGHLVAKALKAEGIDVIFTLCGGHIIDIYDGCLDEGIKIIDVRHEQVAAHAADGYARMTGKPGCAVVTAGPGTTDAMTGVANAFRAESPFLLIGGQSALSQHMMGGLQNLPHVDMMRPITKFASQVQTTERIPDMISMAFRECYNGAPGPAFLEIPRDVLDAKVDVAKARLPQAGHYRASTRLMADPDDVQKLADILVKSERPCVLLGTQVATCRAYDDAKEFVRKLNIPAYMNGSGRGTLPPGDPHHLHRTRSYAFEKADVIVIVGTPFDFRMGYGKRLNAQATVAQIDLDYRTVGKNRDISLGLVGDVGMVLKAVTAAATGRTDIGAKKRQAWIDELHAAEKKALEKFLPDFKSDSTPINPYRVAWELNEFLTEDTIYIGDGGDGAFSMTGWDFETAVRFKLPFLGVIGNNSSMNQIRCGQIMKYGKERGDIGNMLGDVPYGKFAEILGGHGEEVRDPKQIRPALERAREAVAGGKPALVNIWVDINVWAPGTKNQTMYK